MHRWIEHDKYFRMGSGPSIMYEQNLDPDRVVYTCLLTNVEIALTCKLTTVSTWCLEFAEWIYIRMLQPKYNINGKTRMF